MLKPDGASRVLAPVEEKPTTLQRKIENSSPKAISELQEKLQQGGIPVIFADHIGSQDGQGIYLPQGNNPGKPSQGESIQNGKITTCPVSLDRIAVGRPVSILSPAKAIIPGKNSSPKVSPSGIREENYRHLVSQYF